MCNCTMNIYNKLYISIFQHQTNETKRFVQNALYPSAHTALACRWRNNREGGGGGIGQEELYSRTHKHILQKQMLTIQIQAEGRKRREYYMYIKTYV